MRLRAAAVMIAFAALGISRMAWAEPCAPPLGYGSAGTVELGGNFGAVIQDAQMRPKDGTPTSKRFGGRAGGRLGYFLINGVELAASVTYDRQSIGSPTATLVDTWAIDASLDPRFVLLPAHGAPPCTDSRNAAVAYALRARPVFALHFGYRFGWTQSSTDPGAQAGTVAGAGLGLHVPMGPHVSLELSGDYYYGVIRQSGSPGVVTSSFFFTAGFVWHTNRRRGA